MLAYGQARKTMQTSGVACNLSSHRHQSYIIARCQSYLIALNKLSKGVTQDDISPSVAKFCIRLIASKSSNDDSAMAKLPSSCRGEHHFVPLCSSSLPSNPILEIKFYRQGATCCKNLHTT